MRHQKQRLPFVAPVGNLNGLYCFVHHYAICWCLARAHVETGETALIEQLKKASRPCACGNGEMERERK